MTADTTDRADSQEQPPENLPANVTESRIENMVGYDPDMDFRALALESQYRTKGFRLVSKSVLLGVPHVIVGVTYREGYKQPDGVPGDYVSIEAVVADKATLESNPVRYQIRESQGLEVGELNVFGNEPVVYNDGSTGIRRYLTQMFATAGLIDVGKPKGDENPFDRPYALWRTGAELATEGFYADPDGRKLRLTVMRGLRRSDYESLYGPATTYYLD